MEEIEVLKKAQEYIEKMAKGINPLDGRVIEEDSLINNVRISRCLFYVSGVMKELIAKNGKTKKSKVFVYDSEKAQDIKIEFRPVSLSVILKNIKSVSYGRIKVCPYEITLVMSANRAHFGRRQSLKCITAVEAHPLAFHIGYKKFVLLKQIGKSFEPVPVCLLNLRNLEKGICNRVKAL